MSCKFWGSKNYEQEGVEYSIEHENEDLQKQVSVRTFHSLSKEINYWLRGQEHHFSLAMCPYNGWEYLVNLSGVSEDLQIPIVLILCS